MRKTNCDTLASKTRKTRGVALIFSIMIVAIIAIVGGFFVRKSGLLRTVDFTQKQQSFQSVELLTEAQAFYKSNLIDILDQNLVPSNLDPSTDVTSLDARYNFNDWLDAQIAAPYNARAENIQKGKRLSIRCLYQQNPTQGQPVREFPCTAQRYHEPKLFEISFSRLDSTSHTLTTTTEQVEVSRPSATQFGYIVTSASSSIALGNVSFDSPVAFYFKDPIGVNGIYFAASAPGTIFNAPVFTNLMDSSKFVNHQGVASFSFNSSLTFNSQRQKLVDTIETTFDQLKAATTTVNSANPLTTKQSLALADCIAVWSAVDANVAADGTCGTSVDYAGFHFNGSNLTIRERVSWHYSGTNTAVLPHHKTMPNDLVQTGPQSSFEGQVIYVPGKAFIKETPSLNSHGKTTHIYASMTLMADDIVIQNSIVKNSASKNLGLFAHSSIRLSEFDEQSPMDQAILDNGTSGGITLSNLKKTNSSDISSTQTSFKIQASMITAQEAGGFIIPPAYFDGKPAVRKLGGFEIDGLLVSAETFVTSALNSSNQLSGFTKVKMSQGQGLLEYPPPGLKFRVDMGLRANVINTSISHSSLSDALADLQRR